jgi:hypothetical protein
MMAQSARNARGRGGDGFRFSLDGLLRAGLKEYHLHSQTNKVTTQFPPGEINMSKASTHTNANLTAKDLYEQGSKCCQQYSQLTMQIRTLAQHIMIAYAVGIGIFLSQRGPASPAPGLVLFGAGIILIVFAFVLCLLNLHHSMAFRAIRDNCLIKLENGMAGPWKAHEGERTGHSLSSKLAWYSPFGALVLIGFTSLWLGAVLTFIEYIQMAAGLISFLTILGIDAVVTFERAYRQENKYKDAQTAN